jgi:branched-subunit amino acid ABC-type transport system permease component
MDLFFSALITGVGLGSMYGLLALGFYVTYAVSGTVNFAQGSTMMLGAVAGFTFGVTLGYEPAELLEAVPGPEISRHVLAVHHGKLYHLTFTPVDPSNDKAYAQMQALYDLVVRSFRFIPPGR